MRNYKTFKALGGFEPQRPLSVKESVKQLLTQQTEMLMQHINNKVGSGCGASPLNWQGWEQLQEEAQQDELQRQQHPLTPEEVMATLERVAAGELQPSLELVQRLRQQKDVLADAMNDSANAAAGSPAEGAAAADAATAGDGPSNAAASAPGCNAAAAGVSGAAVEAAAGAGGTAAGVPGTSSAVDAAFQVRQAAAGSTSAAAAATAGSSPAAQTAQAGAGQPDRPASPDVVLSYMVDEPQDDDRMMCTPSGEKYTLRQLRERTAHTLTPGGTHCTAFYMGQPVEEQQQQGVGLSGQQQQGAVQQHTLQQQQLLQQQPRFVPQPHPQQQQLVSLLTSQQQQLELLQQLAQQGGLMQQQQQQQPPEGGLQHQQPAQAAVLQQLQVMQQQVQQSLQLLQQQAAKDAQQQQLQQQLHGARQRSNSILQTMGQVDPIANIWQPYIASQPGLNAVLGAANNASLSLAAPAGSSNAAMLLAALAMREDSIVERTVSGVIAAFQGNAAFRAAGGPSQAATTAPATTAATGTTATNTNGDAGAGGQGATKQQLGSSSSKAVKGKSSEAKVGFPALSKHSTLAQLAEWYYFLPHQDTGKTPQQLEAAGQDDDYQWRGGSRHRHQRWAEYVQLLKAIEAEQDRLTDEERRRSSHPHRVVRVGAEAAALRLDGQRSELGLSVCEYREYVNGKGKGYNKGKAKEAELQQLQQEQEEPAAS